MTRYLNFASNFIFVGSSTFVMIAEKNGPWGQLLQCSHCVFMQITNVDHYWTVGAILCSKLLVVLTFQAHKSWPKSLQRFKCSTSTRGATIVVHVQPRRRGERVWLTGKGPGFATLDVVLVVLVVKLVAVVVAVAQVAVGLVELAGSGFRLLSTTSAGPPRSAIWRRFGQLVAAIWPFKTTIRRSRLPKRLTVVSWLLFRPTGSMLATATVANRPRLLSCSRIGDCFIRWTRVLISNVNAI